MIDRSYGAEVRRLEWLAEHSAVAVRGTVARIERPYHAQGDVRDTIYHDVEVSVGRTYAGPSKDLDSIVVRVVGGTIGGVTMSNPQAPVFSVGEEVILFLDPVGSAPGTYDVVADFHGKFTVSGDRAERDHLGTEPLSEVEAAARSVGSD